MNAAWIYQDRAQLRSLMAEWENAGNLTAHPRRTFEEPEHNTTGDPALFTAWMMARYDQVERGYFDGDSGPERTGVLRVLFWLQPGRGGALLDGPTGVYQRFLTLISTFEETSYLNFFPPVPVDDTERDGRGGEVWHVEGIEIPFKVA